MFKRGDEGDENTRDVAKAPPKAEFILSIFEGSGRRRPCPALPLILSDFCETKIVSKDGEGWVIPGKFIKIGSNRLF